MSKKNKYESRENRTSLDNIDKLASSFRNPMLDHIESLQNSLHINGIQLSENLKNLFKDPAIDAMRAFSDHNDAIKRNFLKPIDTQTIFTTYHEIWRLRINLLLLHKYQMKSKR